MDFTVQEMACIHYANYIGDLDLLQASSHYLKLDQKNALHEPDLLPLKNCVRDHSYITLDWVCGFRNWPFLLVGGLENPPKQAYVIFEWFLMQPTKTHMSKVLLRGYYK